MLYNGVLLSFKWNSFSCELDWLSLFNFSDIRILGGDLTLETVIIRKTLLPELIRADLIWAAFIMGAERRKKSRKTVKCHRYFMNFNAQFVI